MAHSNAGNSAGHRLYCRPTDDYPAAGIRLPSTEYTRCFQARLRIGIPHLCRWLVLLERHAHLTDRNAAVRHFQRIIGPA